MGVMNMLCERSLPSLSCDGKVTSGACVGAPSQALARLRCEADWLRLGREQGARALVLRLGGIYGPGRSALDTAQASADRGDRPGAHTETRHPMRAVDPLGTSHVADSALPPRLDDTHYDS